MELGPEVMLVTFPRGDMNSKTSVRPDWASINNRPKNPSYLSDSSLANKEWIGLTYRNVGEGLIGEPQTATSLKSPSPPWMMLLI